MAAKRFKSIPRISRISFLQSMFGLGGDKPYLRIHKQKELWVKKLGSIIRFPGRPALVEVYNPQYISTLLRADDKWPRRPILPLISQAIKRGALKPSISHVNGAEWAEIRSKMQKIFLKPGAASQFYKAQLSVCEEFVSALLQQQENQTGSVTNLRIWACRFAAESVGRILIGGKLDSFSDNKRSSGSQLCEHMDRLFQLTAAGMYQPSWSNLIETKLYKQWLREYTESKLLVEELISKYGFQQHKSDSPYSPHTFFLELLAKQEHSVQEAVDFAQELFIAGVESVN